MTQVLVVAEHNHKTVSYATLATLSAALKLSDKITILVAGYQCESVVEELKALKIAQHIFWVDDNHYQHELAENLAKLIVDVVQEKAALVIPGISFTHVLAGATTFGKNILPRVAALLNMGQISEVLQILSPDTFVRAIYAGNILVTVQALDSIKILTIRPTSFESIEKREKVEEKTEEATFQYGTMVHHLTPNINAEVSTFIELKQEPSERPELSAAKIVISGGRGLQSRENFKMLEALADQLGAALGASRAAVDAGFVPNEYQVGQTGKVVAPNVYFAVGISGAIQHVSGIKDSKIIVAINKDAEAPIFALADYGLVGDLFQIIPELSEQLKNRKLNKLNFV